jgi:hypothetical protein
MIIQINATVCAAVDHGGGGQFKIAGRGQRDEMQEARKGAVSRRNDEFREHSSSAGSCSRCSMA